MITVDTIMATRPCVDWPRARVERLAARLPRPRVLFTSGYLDESLEALGITGSRFLAKTVVIAVLGVVDAIRAAISSRCSGASQ